MTCTHCGADTARPPRTICDTCHGFGERLLGDVPAIAAMLTTTITRQRGIDYRTLGAGGNDKPLPVNLAASDAHDHLHAVLVAWVLWCRDENLRSAGLADTWPTNSPASTSAWLLGRWEAVSRTDLAHDLISELDEATARARRCVDSREAKLFVGECGCGHALFAPRGAEWVVCRACETGHDPQVIRADLLDQLGGLIVTAAEFADYVTGLGLRADRERIRERVKKWRQRGHVSADPQGNEFAELWAILRASEEAA